MIQLEHATKTFRDTTALCDVSITFADGKIHGIIGRNGSGKTVLLKCICGFLQLTSGTVTVDGIDVRHTQPRGIGLIIETPGFVSNLSGFRNLKLLASLQSSLTDSEIRQVMEQVGLDPHSRTHVGKYSLGMRQRLGIAQAIMEHPKLLILDEPMNGLDKQGVQEIRTLLLELNRNGVTILLTSHYAEDIELLCHTVCEMDHGVLTKISGWEETPMRS